MGRGEVLVGDRPSILDKFCYENFASAAEMKAFLRRFRLDHKGTIAEMVGRLARALDEGEVPREAFAGWFLECVHGGRKHVYVSTLQPDSINGLGPGSVELAATQHEGLVVHQIDAVDEPVGRVCIFRQWYREGQELRLGFVERCQPKVQGVIRDAVNYYSFVDVHLDTHTIVVWVPSAPHVQISGTTIETVTTDRHAETIRGYVGRTLGVAVEDAVINNCQLVYRLWQRNSECPEALRQRITAMEATTKQYMADVAQALDIANLQAEALILGTIQSMWTRALLLDVEGTADEAPVGPRDGRVLGSQFRDRTNAMGQTRSIEAVDQSDLHYILYAVITLYGAERFRELTFEWSRSATAHNKPVKCDVLTTGQYIRLRFSGQVLPEEVYRRVLSKIDEYRQE